AEAERDEPDQGEAVDQRVESVDRPVAGVGGREERVDGGGEHDAADQIQDGAAADHLLPRVLSRWKALVATTTTRPVTSVRVPKLALRNSITSASIAMNTAPRPVRRGEPSAPCDAAAPTRMAASTSKVNPS